MIEKKPLIVSPHRISREHKKKAKKIGRGNESRGVRTALDTYKLEVRSETMGDIIINPNK